MRLFVLLFAALVVAHATHLIGPYNVAEGFTFGVIGDWGMGGFAGGWNQEIISTRRYTETCKKLGCNFTISVGDNFYCGRVEECIQHSFEEDMKNVLGPFFLCIGNHDNVGAQIAYSKRNPKWYFPTPYYTVKLPIDDTGYTVQIFAVNGNGGDLNGGAQLDWLRSELAKSDARWKIIFGHYPTSGSGRHKRVRSVGHIHQVMKEFNAQAYFSGHDHIVEMNNVEGRLLGISGGMSRGAMMDRGRGGTTRRFTLTNPSEYSPYIQPWPSHGFMTVDMSPNTMNVNIWDSNGGMHYECTVTHDWMKRVMDFPEAVRHMWPPPAVVRQALKDELSLPRGPGGGTVFLPDGTRLTAPENATADKNSTKVPTEQSSTSSTTSTTSTTSPPTASTSTTTTTTTTVAPAPYVPFNNSIIPDYIQYAVSTECDVCGGELRVGRPFTLRLSGTDVEPSHRLFLTGSPDGCQGVRKPLMGSEVVTPTMNTVRFTVTTALSEVYVCLSLNEGFSYGRILREDDLVHSLSFSVLAV